MEPSLDTMISNAAATIGGSQFAPKSSSSAGFSWADFLKSLLGGFITQCKPNAVNPQKANKRLMALANQAVKGKENIRVPGWVYEAAAAAGMKSEKQQTAGIHATLLYVGMHPDLSTEAVMRTKNEQDKLAGNGVEKTDNDF